MNLINSIICKMQCFEPCIDEETVTNLRETPAPELIACKIQYLQ